MFYGRGSTSASAEPAMRNAIVEQGGKEVKRSLQTEVISVIVLKRNQQRSILGAKGGLSDPDPLPPDAEIAI
ncbi:hypothetical protein T05_14626 [Trichinella murrelli]|uniref:Uncharacterized protein n=1 Tax=Trichinella murrelli TaxID=144512 RepID=A0A0V0TBL1_9BILA|nr:hypothetical protein T05_14626 [Trichinella murrelli]